METAQKTKFTAMLHLQGELNSFINQDWLNAGYPFLRAAFVEAGEALDHYGWKWWKHQDPNLVQLQIELIDILHFYLSDVMVVSNGDLARSLISIEQELGQGSVEFDGSVFSFVDLSLLEMLELLAGLAVMRRRSFGLLSELMSRCEMTWDSAYVQYVSKNILNVFRQRNGYKLGTYIKIWDGLEDNVWLEQTLQSLNSSSLTFSNDLLAKLDAKYKSVLCGG
jgi:hypothetical protein